MRYLKFYDQEVLSDPSIGQHGDCFRACVRTLLQLEEPLPHPVAPEGGWSDEFIKAMDSLGWTMNGRPLPAPEGWDYDFLPRVLIAGGPTKRTPQTQANHAVIWDRVANRMIHDPHPSRDGLLHVTRFYWFEEL